MARAASVALQKLVVLAEYETECQRPEADAEVFPLAPATSAHFAMWRRVSFTRLRRTRLFLGLRSASQQHREGVWGYRPEWAFPSLAMAKLFMEGEYGKRGTDCVMLMIDEAQNLVVHHYSMLKVLIDELIDLKRSPFLLLAAQPEIQQRPDELLKKNFHDLVDRFFTRWHRMRGRYFTELEGFLSAYDNLRWSPDKKSGTPVPTFTEFFAPRLANSGGLAVLAPQFAEAFREINREVGRLPEDELETKYVVSTLRVFLLEVSENTGALSPKDLAKVIRRAVQRSGIFENRRRVGDAEHLFKKAEKNPPRLGP